MLFNASQKREREREQRDAAHVPSRGGSVKREREKAIKAIGQDNRGEYLLAT